MRNIAKYYEKYDIKIKLNKKKKGCNKNETKKVKLYFL